MSLTTKNHKRYLQRLDNPTKATCCPEKAHYAKGLCINCYQRKAKRENEELRKRGVRRSVQWAKDHPEKLSASHLRRAYGLTVEQYEEMEQLQKGLCAMCHQPPKASKSTNIKLHVDHNHETGRVRGLLCTGCNTRLSTIENKEFRLMAEGYLEKYDKWEYGKHRCNGCKVVLTHANAQYAAALCDLCWKEMAADLARMDADSHSQADGFYK